MEIFKLFGSIFIDNEKANKSIDDTNKKGENTEGTFTKMIGTAAKWGVAIGAGAIAAGGAMLAIATKAGNAADRLLDLNSITGMTTDEIQRWERVTKVAGVSTDAMTNASQKLTKSLNAMDSEGNKSRKAIEQLGLSFTDIEKMSADERMNAIAQALAGVDDKTERARLGTDLLGGSWKEIAPIIDLGTEAMDKAKDSANIISEEDLQKANEFRISMEEMKDKVSYLAMELAIKLLPIAEKVFEWVDKAMPTIMEIVDFALTTIGEGIERLIGWIERIIEWGKKWYDENKDTVDGIVDSFMEFFSIVQEFFKSFIDIVKQLWERYGEDILNIAKKYLGYIKDQFELAFDIIKGIFEFFTALFKGDWEGMGNALIDIVKNALKLIENVFDSGLDIIFDILRLAGKVVLDLGKDMMNFLWDGIKYVWDSIANWVSEKVGWLADKLAFWKTSSGQMATTSVPGISNSNSINTSKGLAGLANGGTTLTSGRVLVGERGPEELYLPAGATVKPLGGSGSADITIILDGREIGKAVAQPLTNQIRVATGLKI